MIKHSFVGVALALATATLAAQATKPAPRATKPATGTPKAGASQTPKAQNPYVPAIEKEKIAVSGCLKHESDWVLTDATVAGKQDKATYKLEGIGDARLALFVGKRVEATGALQQEAGKPATAKSLPRFEATAVKESTGNCP